MKSIFAKLVPYVILALLFFGLGYFTGTGFDTSFVTSDVLNADEIQGNIDAIEGNDFFVGLKEYPSDFPKIPYFDKLTLGSVSKLTEDGVQTYLVHLSANYGTPVSHIEGLKSAFEKDLWSVQTPDPLDGIYTLHAEKDNFTLNMTLEGLGEAGASVTVSLKVL